MPIPSYVIPSAGLAAARPAAGSPGRIYYSTDTITLERDNGTAWETYASVVAGAALWSSYCCIIDQKAQNTNGGAFNNGAWRTRDINTEQTDPDGIVAIAANQFVLDAGTYLCIASAPAYQIDRHQTRLYNATGAAVLVTGTSELNNVGASFAYATRSFVVGRFTVAGAQSLEIQHQCQTTRAAIGFGIACNFTDEVYTIAEFWLEA